MPRVRKLEVFRVVLPHGRRTDSLLVKLTDQGGMTGWGETVSPAPKAWSRLEESLAALLIGVDWEHPDSVASGDSAVDMACWDLWTRMRGVPLADAIGGTRTSLMATVRLSPDASLESLVTRVNQQVCAGYGHVTLDIRPGWDVEPVRAVRAAYPALTLAVDCGGAYTDRGQLVALDSYGLEVIERPFPVADVYAHASLQDEVAASVAVEVCATADLDDYLTLRAARVLLLRPTGFPSISEARRAHDRAVAAGWDIQCSGGQGAGLARAATVAVASLPGCTLPCDVTQPPRNNQIVTPIVGANAGVIAVPLTQPGLGHSVDESRVRRLARDVFTS
ncbi:enolase C-terminal domain-like protein [Nonomuraea cavernae]|uniref:O-succinylbenzoate synthase n=1 Tax=Nonomuraea cavernae TaxID=2045107 RepID=A0A918DSP5_9ACTN|nr:enolase C-terminal domain-like protein [Nonomuraea cavernae]MCA2190769.1 O-succinylbenzoate-CoA synthase [Nonomuraea cavernae]GGO82392.1 o-succinylbenzoate synthase [Nonomuraea cavernae]